jgi:hypothetical protein
MEESMTPALIPKPPLPGFSVSVLEPLEKAVHHKGTKDTKLHKE